MPIRSGAMQRPCGWRCGNTLRQRYDEVGLPCSSTIGSPCPTSTYAISRPRTRRRSFLYGNAAEILFAFPLVVDFIVCEVAATCGLVMVLAPGFVLVQKLRSITRRALFG